MLEFEELTYKIRACVYEVYRELGHGFLEQVYERALLKELTTQGMKADCQVSLPVHYKGDIIAKYYADIIVENKVIIALKAQNKSPSASESQLLNYLRAANIKVGLLVNFTYPKAVIKRLVI